MVKNRDGNVLSVLSEESVEKMRERGQMEDR